MKNAYIFEFIKHHTNAIVLFLLAVVGLCLFTPGLYIRFYGDDFGYILDPTRTSISSLWTTSNLHGWYRPIQMTYMYLVQQFWGWSTLPIHAAQLLLHIGLAFGVYQLAIRLGFTRLQAIIASFWFLISQANPIAVQRATTISTTLASFFGFFSVSLLLQQEMLSDSRKRLQLAQYGTALLCFLLALFSKESSSSLLILLAMVLFGIRTTPLRFGLRLTTRTCLAFVPFLLVFGLYFLVRQQSGANPPVFGSGDYEFALSETILKNISMLLLAGLTPVSTVTTFLASQAGPFLLLFLSLLAPFCVIVTTGFGLAVSGSWRTGVVLFLFGLISLFPMAALNHISELYAYHALPFLSLIIGVGWGAAITPVKIRRPISVLLAILLIGSGVLNILSLESKTAMMMENGQRAESLLRQLPAWINRVPSGGQLLLVNPPEKGPSYSVFLIHGFDVFSGARQIVQQVSGRSDFSVKISSAEEIQGIPLDSDVVPATLLGGTVVNYP